MNSVKQQNNQSTNARVSHAEAPGNVVARSDKSDQSGRCILSTLEWCNSDGNGWNDNSCRQAHISRHVACWRYGLMNATNMNERPSPTLSATRYSSWVLMWA